MSAGDIRTNFALDMQGLERLKHTAKSDPRAGAKEVARQFEALMLQQMLKSMRAATPKSDLLGSSQMDIYTDMLDQQMAQHLSDRGMGLAEQFERQLLASGRQDHLPPDEPIEKLIAGIPRGIPQPLYGSQPLETINGSKPDRSFATADRSGSMEHLIPGAKRKHGISSTPPLRGDQAPSVERFIAQMREPAKIASRASGVHAELIIAQAALETGWGQRQIPTSSGGNSHNLFGIKAGSHWRGATTEVTTTEYVDGRPQKQVEKFRAYPNYQAAFTDYANLIGSNPRYAGVVNAETPDQAARALQRGGYASDPAYAEKLVSIMAMIGPVDTGVNIAQVTERNLVARNQ